MTNEPGMNGNFNPFPGLRAFEEEEEYLFFGREKQVDELLTKLSAHRFLAVIGSSGSGKSSLVKSGLLPALFRGFMAGAGSSWRIAVMRPGSSPITNLAAALASVVKTGENPEFDEVAEALLESSLRRSRLGLGDVVNETLRGKTENVLIVVDQFEELFRFSRYEKESNNEERESLAFVNLLLEASSRANLQLYIAITMRSDFLGNCTEFRGLPEAINHGLYLIPRMTRDEIRSAITGPVAVGGGTITPMLVSRLLNDVGDNPDQLPILQHALMRTWQCRQKENNPAAPLDVKHYEQIGTMKQALSQHAEEAYAELKTERLKNVCESIFRALTEKRPDMPGTRRPTSVADLAAISNATEEEVKTVIEIFRSPERSFLVPPHSVPLTSSTVVDISHESLMRVWERLVRWVEDEADSAEVFLRLVKAAHLYKDGKGGFYRSPELDFALRWREQNHPNEAWGTKLHPDYSEAMKFLSDSEENRQKEEAEKQQQQKKKKRKVAIAIVAGIVALCTISTGAMYLSEEHTMKETTRIVQEIDEARSLSLKASHLASDFTDSSRMLEASNMALKSYDLLRKLYPGNSFRPDMVNFLALDKIFWAEKKSRFNIKESDSICAIANLRTPGEAVFVTKDSLFALDMNAKNGLLVSAIPVHELFDRLAVSPGDKYVAAGSPYGQLVLYSKSGRNFHPDFESPDSSGGAIIGMDFIDDNALSIVRRSGAKLIALQMELPACKEKNRKEISIPSNSLVHVSHSRIVVASADKIDVYSLSNAGTQFEKTITGLHSPVTTISVSPGGEWIAWGTKGGSVLVYKIKSRRDTGQELPRLSHSGEITSLLFFTERVDTDSGAEVVPYLASGGYDGQIVIVQILDAMKDVPEEDPIVIVSDLPRIGEMEYNSGAFMLMLKNDSSICTHIINLDVLVAEVTAIRDSLEKVVKKR